MVRAYDALHEVFHVHGMLAAFLASSKQFYRGLRNRITQVHVIFSESAGPTTVRPGPGPGPGPEPVPTCQTAGLDHTAPGQAAIASTRFADTLSPARGIDISTVRRHRSGRAGPRRSTRQGARCCAGAGHKHCEQKPAIPCQGYVSRLIRTLIDRISALEHSMRSRNIPLQLPTAQTLSDFRRT